MRLFLPFNSLPLPAAFSREFYKEAGPHADRLDSIGQLNIYPPSMRTSAFYVTNHRLRSALTRHAVARSLVTWVH